MPKCNAKTEVYSRVVGYFRPTTCWNPGKQSEFKQRVPFKLSGGFDKNDNLLHGLGNEGNDKVGERSE